MKKLFEFKQESLIMTIVIFVYAIIAGGSVGFLFEGTFWAMIGGVIAIIIIVAIIDSIVNEQNKKKRLLAKSNFETEMKYSDISDKIGDDKCTLYFDKESKSVLIASINTEKVTQYKINNFIKDYVAFANGSYCAVDATQRKALVVKNNGISKNFKEVDYSDKDSNKDIIDSNEIKPIFQEFIIKTNASSPIKPTFVLVEESFGYITFFKENSIDSFNYIAKGYIASKKGQKSSVNVKHIGTYVFILDDFFKVLTIASPTESKTILNYKDIINVTYEEDGNTLFSKSTGRTVGGAIVGGALLGGAGAIVGGLSGNSTQNKEIKSMSIKILVRNVNNPTITLKINLINEVFNTKDESSKKNYSIRLGWANQIKDLISVVINDSNQPSLQPQYKSVSTPKPKMSSLNVSVADELAKLAKLKESGILTEEEFNAQKSKLLGL